ncbi:phage virion morphogenesis protein [Martelella mediterranea]|uniref:phage virion morphogenesis protein n=1 Tax=Martelella mediterranea TaxID=293089 RepID=UPI001E4E846A|nr:phage virion morphogenesis protein [Martelella mediterranea]MCD1634481.1 phage virion morphogenesis protein [Martelella mediterranea]
MAAATLTIRDETIDAGLTRLYEAADTITPALKNIGEHEASATRRRFVDEEDPQGRAWKPLNPLYRKTKKGSGILKGESRSLSQIIWQLVDDTSVEVGSNEIYARIHNEGGVIKAKDAPALVFSMGGKTIKVKSVTIPKRQFLGLSEKDRADILDIIEDHFAPFASAE